MKQKKKKGVGSEMRFGVNTAAPFVGLKREEGSDYPFSKQVSRTLYCDFLLVLFLRRGQVSTYQRVSHKRERIFHRTVYKCML